jgi:alkylhydroperoxidase family enzyme
MSVSPRVDVTVREGSAMDRATLEFCETVERASSVDLVTTEVVRLRCANYHNCRACASYRNRDALEDGLDEALVEKISHYEESDLPERWKVALRLADAVIIAPGDVDVRLASDLHEHFTDEQIADLRRNEVEPPEGRRVAGARYPALGRADRTHVRRQRPHGVPRAAGAAHRMSGC